MSDTSLLAKVFERLLEGNELITTVPGNSDDFFHIRCVACYGYVIIPKKPPLQKWGPLGKAELVLIRTGTCLPCTSRQFLRSQMDYL